MIMKNRGIIFLILFLLLYGGKTRGQEDRALPRNQFARNYNLAKSAFDRGDLETAGFYLNACLEKRPHDKDALLLRAMCHRQSGKVNAALRDYTLLLEENPEFVEALYGRGLLVYEKKLYGPAANDFKKILEVPFSETQAVFYKRRPFEQGISGVGTIETMKADIYNYLGLCAFKMNHYQEALDYFTEAISRFNEDADFYINRGLTFEASGQAERAVEDYKKAMEISPENEIAAYNLSRLQAGSPGTQNKEAIRSFTEIIERNPEMAGPYYNRALAFFNAERYDEALKDYDQAILLDSSSANTWYNRGLTKEQLGDLDGALSDFDQAINLQPNFAKAWHGKGVVLAKLKQYRNAISMYDLALHYDPEYALAYYNRGIAKLYLKQTEAACMDLKNAYRLGMSAANEMIDRKCK